MNEVCAVAGCGRRFKGKGLCTGHLMRLTKTGSVNADVPLETRLKKIGMTCSVPNCGRPVEGTGLCNAHWQRKIKNGSVDASVPIKVQRIKQSCEVPGCVRPARSNGLCNAHRIRIDRHGVVKSDVPIELSRRHGLSDHPLYDIWNNMINRCNNARNPLYKFYGGRGIRVCDRWHLVENFIVDMHPRPNDMSIDRIDVNGNYEKSNCRWATDKEQMNNVRSNRHLTFAGETLTITDWAKRLGATHRTIGQRLDKLGWSIEKALTTPGKQHG